MKLIIILSLITVSFRAYSQTGPISPKSIRIGTSGPNVIKWSTTLAGTDTTHDNFVPTSKAVNDRIRGISVTDIKRSNDSIFARINNIWVYKYKDSLGSASNPAAQIKDSLDALRATLVFDVIHTATTTNTTPVTIDTLVLAANTQATFYLTFHGYDNTGVLNDALWYERRVLVKYSDGSVPTPTVQVIGTDYAEGTLNAVPPPVTFVVSGTLVFIKVASSSTMNIPWSVTRTDRKASSITAH